jgi:hypothetical protein
VRSIARTSAATASVHGEGGPRNTPRAVETGRSGPVTIGTISVYDADPAITAASTISPTLTAAARGALEATEQTLGRQREHGACERKDEVDVRHVRSREHARHRDHRQGQRAAKHRLAPQGLSLEHGGKSREQECKLQKHDGR